MRRAGRGRIGAGAGHRQHPGGGGGGPRDQAADARRRLPRALIGDFHYNGHLLLSRHPDCARALDKYRINPGNVGTGARRDDHFATICRIARDNGKPVRIGVNGGSLDQDLVMAKMQENTDRQLGRTSEEIINDCMVISAVESTALAIDAGLGPDRIVISCKVSSPPTSSPSTAASRPRPPSPCTSA